MADDTAGYYLRGGVDNLPTNSAAVRTGGSAAGRPPRRMLAPVLMLASALAAAAAAAAAAPPAGWKTCGGLADNYTATACETTTSTCAQVSYALAILCSSSSQSVCVEVF
eukprot:SAG31_NODE_2207_length_6189_cov_5.894253_6_plen_110_part_00